MRTLAFFSLFCLALGISFCSGRKKTKSTLSKSDSTMQAFAPVFSPGPPTIVFKMKEDYSLLVPINLTENHNDIASYPDPKDILKAENLSKPTALSEGYWLDNRGLGPNAVYLDYTLEVYSQLESLPARDSLLRHIKEKYPFIEMCDCGNRKAYTENVVEQLNYWISTGKLKAMCKQISLP
jgi:hypothetical protein